MSRAPEPVDLLGASDPTAAFREAHRHRRLLALRTSGTTDCPRTVVRTTTSWVASFDAVSELLAMRSHSAVWIPGPLTATMNLFAAVHATSLGAHVVPDAQGASHAVLTPLALARALDAEILESGVTVVVAGDVVTPVLREKCLRQGVHLHHYYGASELSFVAWAAQGADLALFPGVECRIVDDEIWVRSPYLCRGYLDDDGSGPLRWSPDGFATVGDRGEWRQESLVVRGRGDAGITTAGVTVVVADVEAVLRQDAIGDVIVVGVPDERLGAVVCGVVTDEQDVPRLRATARARLGSAHRPHRWYVVPGIPMTSAGKPDRGALAALLAAGGVDPVGHGPREPGGTMAT